MLRVPELPPDLPALIAGCEAAWAFFGGIFRIIIPDNMAADRGPGASDRAADQPGVRRVRPGPRVRDRRRARVRSPTDKGLASHCTSWAGWDGKGMGGLTGEPIMARLPGRGCDHVSRASSGPTRSEMATGSSQFGQQPPMPTRRVKAPHSWQRWLPSERVEQLSHS